jgi:hypothetical protein
MTPEEREHFDAFVTGMMTDLAPVNTHETFLANCMAEEAWRLNQIRARYANLAAVGDFDGAGDNYRPMEAENSKIETAVIETAVIDAVVTRDNSRELGLMSLCTAHPTSLRKIPEGAKRAPAKPKSPRSSRTRRSPPLLPTRRYTGLILQPCERRFCFFFALYQGPNRAPPQAYPREKNGTRLPKEK